MSDKPLISGIPSEGRRRSRFAQHRVTLIVTWLVSTGAFVFMLSGAVRSTGAFQIERFLLQTAYAVALL